MATTKITLNELRSIVKQIIKEENDLSDRDKFKSQIIDTINELTNEFPKFSSFIKKMSDYITHSIDNGDDSSLVEYKFEQKIEPIIKKYQSIDKDKYNVVRTVFAKIKTTINNSEHNPY